jgi:hypothetical protein
MRPAKQKSAENLNHPNKNAMKLHWFVRKGILYWPASIVGWLVLMAAIVYAVYLFIDIDSRSHSASDTLINWVFNCFILAVGYSLIGFLAEKRK